MREAGANLSRIFRVIEGLKVGLKAAEGCMDEWTWTDCATETGTETGAETGTEIETEIGTEIGTETRAETDRGPEAETGAEKESRWAMKIGLPQPARVPYSQGPSLIRVSEATRPHRGVRDRKRQVLLYHMTSTRT